MPYDQRFAEFNESTYAQWATAEVTHWLLAEKDLMAVPITPNLTDEADLGYDLGVTARWGMVYLQYKISEYMRGRTAAEYWHWGHPYFRFKVKTDRTSNWKIQHNTLCDLEDREIPRGGLVYYMAPIFLTEDELFTHLSNQTVVDHSVFASPLQLGPVAPDAVHRYTYTCQRDVVPFSEPGPERPGDFGLIARSIREVVGSNDRELLAGYLDLTAEVLREVSSFDLPPELPAVQRIARMSYALSLQPVLVRYESAAADAEVQEPFE